MNMLIRKIIETFDRCKDSSHISSVEKNSVVHEKCLLKDILVYKYENVFPRLSSVKFGVEIEFQATAKDISGEDILKEFEKGGVLFEREVIIGRECKRCYHNWQLMKETSCEWEIISPVMQDNKEDWEVLERVCKVLQRLDFYTDDNCAIHIHVDKKSVLKYGWQYINLMEIYKFLEPLTYGISSGDRKQVSIERIRRYAVTMTYADKKLWGLGMSRNEIREELKNNFHDGNYNFYKTRLVGLNFMTGKTDYQTFEFRTFNGTLKPEIIQFYLRYVFNLLFISVIEENLEIPKMEFGFEDGNKYTYNKKYIDKCIQILNPENYLKQCIFVILDYIQYDISPILFKALNGIYSVNDEKNFV